jgi:hypothetical protein
MNNLIKLEQLQERRKMLGKTKVNSIEEDYRRIREFGKFRFQALEIREEVIRKIGEGKSEVQEYCSDAANVFRRRLKSLDDDITPRKLQEDLYYIFNNFGKRFAYLDKEVGDIKKEVYEKFILEEEKWYSIKNEEDFDQIKEKEVPPAVTIEEEVIQINPTPEQSDTDQEISISDIQIDEELIEEEVIQKNPTPEQLEADQEIYIMKSDIQIEEYEETVKEEINYEPKDLTNKLARGIVDALYGVTVTGSQSKKYYPHMSEDRVRIKMKSIFKMLIRKLWNTVAKRKAKEFKFEWDDIAVEGEEKENNVEEAISIPLQKERKKRFESNLKGNDSIWKKLISNGLNSWNTECKRLCSNEQKTRNLNVSWMPLEVQMYALRLGKLWEKLTIKKKSLFDNELENLSTGEKVVKLVLLSMVDRFIKNLKKKKKFDKTNFEGEFTKVLLEILEDTSILTSSWGNTETLRAAKGR